MVLMAAASEHRHRHAAEEKSSAPASPPSAPAAPARTRLHGFSFPTLSWGTHRLLRCSKDGGASTPASPPPHPHTPSPDKEEPLDSPAGAAGGGGGGSASQPPRKPWNLRARRSATAAPPPASRSDGGAGMAVKSPKPKLPEGARKRCFSVALTKEEIEEDFAAIRGTRPPRRPKKRPRALQRQLDALFPGLSLADVDLDSYKIEER